MPQGITGLWQVTARANCTYGEALDMDVAYARGWSLGLDLGCYCARPCRCCARDPQLPELTPMGIRSAGTRVVGNAGRDRTLAVSVSSTKTTSDAALRIDTTATPSGCTPRPRA